MNQIHDSHWNLAKHSLSQSHLLAYPPLDVSHQKKFPAVKKKLHLANISAPERPLRLGFVPLTDCAPLVMAHELGLFQKYGLRVNLSRELGWATIRDKVIYGELDAAHAVAGMPVAATLGLGSIPCECLTALVLNLHGNAITVSESLWKNGVRDGVALREEIQRLRGEKTFTFGAVYPFSSHNFLLRKWLASSGIDPDRDVRIVIVPPPQMVSNLKAGNLDGFCVGEPWNSVAVLQGVGYCMAISAELEPGHPEKVVMVRREFAEHRSTEHVALLAALLEACEFCDAPENHGELINVLVRPEYVGVPEAALRPGIRGKIDLGHGGVRVIRDFNVFHQRNANEPSGEKIAWVLQHMRDSGLCPDDSALNFALGRRVFCADIFEKAARLRASTKTIPASKDKIRNETPVV
jgi:two-component system, oxyanion-binding sensor